MTWATERTAHTTLSGNSSREKREYFMNWSREVSTDVFFCLAFEWEAMLLP